LHPFYLGFSFQQKLIQIRDKTRKHGEILQMTLDGNPEDQQKQVEKSDETKKAENNQPGPIPYDRFKEVNEQLKTAKSQLEELQQEKEKREKAAKEAEEKRLESQQQFEQLANERKAELEKANSEITTYKAELEAQTAVLSALYESRKSLVPEMFRPLLDSMDLVKRLQWIAENESKLKPASNGVHGIPHTPNPKGTGDLTPEQRRARAKSTW
jgi:chromosome segregation ATPase